MAREYRSNEGIDSNKQRQVTNLVKQLILMLLLLTTACRGTLLLSTPTTVALPTESNDVEQSASMQRLLDDWRAQHDVIGATLAVSVDGSTTVAIASGLANPDTQTALEPNHPMYVGSIAKTFVAAAILQLVQAEQLALDDRLSRWFPRYPHANEITIEQLLNMTSGTFDYFRATPANPFLGMVMQDVTKQWTPDEIIAIAASLEPVAEPGEQYWYSNTNYLLLGRIIEQVTARSLATELRNRFYEPLELHNSYLAGDERVPDNLASGYVREFSFLFGVEGPTAIHPAQYHGLQTVFWAAGGLVSTSSDLVTWAQALFGGDMLDDALLAQMLTPNAFSDDEGSTYGYGVEFYQTAVGPAVGHAGSVPGYASLTFYLPEQQIAIAVTTNDNEHGEPHLAALLNDVLRAAVE